MRIMCDTNVLISGILFPDSVPGKVLREVAGRNVLVLATYIVEELYRVFQKGISKNSPGTRTSCPQPLENKALAGKMPAFPVINRGAQKKFPEKTPNLNRYLERREFELFVTPRDLRYVAMPSVRDAKDAPVIASAILADIDILITGDKDFTNVEIDRPVVLTPTAFLELLKRI